MWIMGMGTVLIMGTDTVMGMGTVMITGMKVMTAVTVWATLVVERLHLVLKPYLTITSRQSNSSSFPCQPDSEAVLA